MRHGTWFNAFSAEGGAEELPWKTREELARIDNELFALWNLGENVLLGWTEGVGQVFVLSVRHHAIPESIHAAAGSGGGMGDPPSFINRILAGPKRLPLLEFERVRRIFDCAPRAVRVDLSLNDAGVADLISDMVRCYGVSLVRNRAVVLLDAVQFSLRSPLDQMAMLNSLAYSVNSAYAQLMSKDIRIDFARTTTGDGFYIWNRDTSPGADTELYKLMMMVLADNAAAQHKSRGSWVPRLRAAFHVGEHYEFHQVEGVNPTRFSYIVGQVTVDLARMLDHALPGQILLGDFTTPEFVESTAATLAQLNGLTISGGPITDIRCYLTGLSDGRRFLVNRYAVRDKHGATRLVYNAKINIYRDAARPIFLGLRTENLDAFGAAEVKALIARAS